MELWKICHFLLALYISAANGEGVPYVSNISGRNKGIKINSAIVFPQDDSDFTTNASNFALFNAKLFDTLSSSSHHQNMVFSPISLQTLLAFIFTVSNGKLYEELSELLGVPKDQAYVAKMFKDILQRTSSKAPPTSLIVANKLYYDYHLGPIDANARILAKNSFDCELEQMDFSGSEKAADIINAWVREKTRNLIQNIVTPLSITGDIGALLLNSVYFKSEWLMKFSLYETKVMSFHVSKAQSVPVNMMHDEDVYRYGDFSKDLKASVLELPYNATNLTMLLILPNDIEGLAELERKLRYYDLEKMTQRLKREIVTVNLPKFEIEFETDMIETLQKLGLNALFNNNGGLNLFVNRQTPLMVSQFKHKAFINVNEIGTEAAAVSVSKIIPLSLPANLKDFTVDHPFVFIIRDGNTILFMGHVIKF